MRRDTGSVSVELSLLTPVLIAMLLFVVYASRVVEAKADVVYSAAEAARAASLATASEAQLVASLAVAANINETNLSCSSLDVDVDTSRFTPGGWVNVTVTCVTDLSDLAMLSVPGSRTFAATGSEIIDVYRARGAADP